MVFNEQFSDEGEKYTGEMKAEKIMGAASKRMQSFVSVVSETNYNNFIERERLTKNKVLLFTDKKTTPTMLKSFSKKYVSRLNLGEVRSSEEALIKKFGVTEFPTIMALTDPENMVGVKYEGDMKFDQVGKFMSQYAYATPKKPVVTEFSELTADKYNSGKLCGVKTSNVCVLIFTRDGDKNLLDMLKPAIGDLADESLSFVYVDETKEPEIHAALGNNPAVLYKPKRHNFQKLPIDSAQALSSAVSDIMGGGGSGTWSKAQPFVF